MGHTLTLKNIAFSYPNHDIFLDFNHTFTDNSYSVVVGPSGFGKSTLIKLICGFLQPQEGLCILNNESYQGFPEDTGLILQEGTLLPWLSVKENIQLGIKLTHKSLDLETLIDDLDIRQLLDKHPRELSGGQKQRVEIARALVTQPKLLILDEATSALDMMTKESIQNLLKSIHQKYNMTVIQVTHDLEEAAFLGEDILMIGKTITKAHSPFANRLDARNDAQFYDYCYALRQSFMEHIL